MLNKKYYLETFDMFRSSWGEESEFRLCIEEMSELTKELCKFMRYSRNEKSQENDEKLKQIKSNIIEETADVLICASQIMHMVGEDEVKKVMDYKIQRGRKIVEDYINKTKNQPKNN